MLWALFMAPVSCSGGCNREREQPAPSSRVSSGEADGPAARSDQDKLEEVAEAPPLDLESPPLDAGPAASVDETDQLPIEGVPLEVGPPQTAWQGPFFTVTKSSVGIYAEPKLERSLKIGYARNGGRLPVLPDVVTGETCSAGWYQLVEHGFICGSDGTIDATAPAARLATTPPNLDAILPYPYARNASNGTPLYSSVPSDDQLIRYQPNLARKSTADGDEGSVERPWWQSDSTRLNDVRLDHLASESDGILAKRMVKGFYIAVDREFEWNGRKWYRTTKGLVAPKERFTVTEGAPFHGVSLGAEWQLPIAWVYGIGRKDRPKYSIDIEKKKSSPKGTVARQEAIGLTGERTELAGKTYLQTSDGFWMDATHIRVAEPRPMPKDLDPKERWIDVDLSSQTLVAYVGTRPVYATLVSSGRESDDPKKDHRTPVGEWRIREKHVTTTMDGDGTAAGDLPYSIEDVPYAMYYHRSYALHAAFWHRNFGVRMSHGCVNLAPLDAKYLFFFSTPHARTGWNGAWPSPEEQGSRVVIHD
jgi:lipoprotein-anchoring transpeptidase ErfK/SrfK